MPSRRQLVSGLVGGAVVGSVIGTSVSLGPVASWTPAEDAWPLRRRDPENTASNLAVAPPADPSVVWRERVLARSDHTTLVVGPERVYAGSDAASEPPNGAVVALGRTDGSRAWTADGVTGSLALFDGRLYAGPADDGRGSLTVYDAATGERDAEVATDGIGERGHLVPTPDGVFLGAGNVLTGRDLDGDARWRRASGGQGVPAVAGGHLYAAGFDAVRYDSRTLSDVPTGTAPEPAWRTSYDATLTSRPPAVVDDTLLAPGAVPSASVDPDAAEPPVPLAGIDTETGTVGWRAFVGSAGDAGSESDDAASSGVVRTTALASDGKHVYAGITSGEQSTRRHGVGVVAVDSGEETVLRSSDDWISDLALVGGRAADGGTSGDPVLLVATTGDWANDEPTQSGTVWAVDTARGTALWRVILDAAVRAIAPVAGAVFAVMVDGTVVKLADAA